MKPFLVRLTKFVAMQVVISAIVLASAHVHFRKGYLASLEDKIDRLESENRPRILFVGGSSVAFGVDSEEFTSSTRQPVNLGLSASLGLDFCANLVEAHVRQGDLVVLMPEHSHLLGKMDPHPIQQRSLLRQCPRGARYLADPWPGPKTFLDQRALPELGCWVQAGIRRLPRNLHDAFATPKGRVYSRASFNQNGDMIAHHGKPSTGKPNRSPLEINDPEILHESIQRLNRCIDYCYSKGASVVYAYPPMTAPQYAASLDELLEIIAALHSELNCPIVTSPEAAVFELDAFFDSAGHLGDVGKAEHTKNLVTGLARYETAIAASPNAIGKHR
jgi:hypothetical protein